ncbi:MAG: response regulator transcription factor [Nitrospinota bacterium]|nr:response regulator transcription factor [Nitrospinota bacterium]
MPKHSKIHVLIADDHAIVRQGIEKVLSKADDVVVASEASNGREVIELVKKTKIDVLLMDVEMPEKTGWEVLSELKVIKPNLPVIILSIFPEEHYGPRFIKAGAAGYLNKASKPATLLEAIRKVHRGGRYVSPKLADLLIQDMGRTSGDKLHDALSPREFQVFCRIAGGKKLKDIAEELSLSITTVSTHRARILEKMNLKTNADLIHYAIKHGIIRWSDPQDQ